MKKMVLIILLSMLGKFQVNSQSVQLYSLPEGEVPAEWNEFRDRLYVILQKQGHYLLNIVHEWEKDQSLKLLTASKASEHWIRPNAGAVAGFSFLYKFGNYDQTIVGISRSELLTENIIPMMRYLVRTHKTGDLNTSEGVKWGDAWQPAHWAALMAKGAWWIWEDLPMDVQQGIRSLVKYEAARFYNITPPAQLELDTKSEENAWNSRIFRAAMLLMPENKDYKRWENLFKKWLVSAYIRPADLKRGSAINGIEATFFSGANIYDDYTLENHGIVHPDYMSAFTLSSQASLDYAMRQLPIPEFVFFNSKGIYENLKWFALPDGGMNYPSGQDWTIFRNPDWLFAHLHMAAFEDDKDATVLARRVLECTEKMQQRNQLGNVYIEQENTFPSAQSGLMFNGSLSWLTLAYMDAVEDKSEEKRGVRLLESGKMILNRTPSAIHSVSWGKKIMFQFVPFTLDRILDASMRNGIGYIKLKGEAEPLPLTLGEDFKLKTEIGKFRATFSVHHGNKITAHYLVQSHRGKMKVSEKLIANEPLITQTIATSMYGVLNNKNWIFEDGKRTIRTGEGKDYEFFSGSGSINIIPSKEVSIDNLLVFRSEKEMRIKYESANKPKQSRITDHLIFNYIKGEKSWVSGQVISDFSYEIELKNDS